MCEMQATGTATTTAYMPPQPIATPPEPGPPPTGCSPVQTGWDPDTVSGYGGPGELGQQLQQGLEQLQSMGVNLGNGPAPAVGGVGVQVGPQQAFGMPIVGPNVPVPATTTPPAGVVTQFAQAEAQQVTVPLVPTVDGPSLLVNLRRISEVRHARLASLERAFAVDTQAGVSNPVDAQKLYLERATTTQVDQLMTKVDQYAGTIDAREAADVLQLVMDANRTGMLDSSGLARVMLQVEGTAANLPASYMQAATQAQDLVAAFDWHVRAAADQLAMEEQATGTVDPGRLAAFNEMGRQRRFMAAVLQQNLQQAKVDPVAAERTLRDALAVVPEGPVTTQGIGRFNEAMSGPPAPPNPVWPNGSDVRFAPAY